MSAGSPTLPVTASSSRSTGSSCPTNGDPRRGRPPGTGIPGSMAYDSRQMSASAPRVAVSGTEVPRSPPPRREGPVVMLGIEGPDIEVLDAVFPVHIVQRSALAQCPAQQTSGIP